MKNREHRQVAFTYAVLLSLVLNLAVGCVNVAQGMTYRATINELGIKIEELRAVLVRHGIMEAK